MGEGEGIEEERGDILEVTGGKEGGGLEGGEPILGAKEGENVGGGLVGTVVEGVRSLEREVVGSAGRGSGSFETTLTVCGFELLRHLTSTDSKVD